MLSRLLIVIMNCWHLVTDPLVKIKERIKTGMEKQEMLGEGNKSLNGQKSHVELVYHRSGQLAHNS